MTARISRAARAALMASGLFAASGRLAHANPQPLPYTYIYETLPKGEAEVELYADLTPLRFYDPSGNPNLYLATQYQLEIETGLTDRLELGLYLTIASTDPTWTGVPNMPEGTGIKQRLRYRFADAGQWPVDLAVYGEVTENEREIELEGKIILQRRAGPFRLVANAWAEREYYYAGQREWVLHPTAGVVFEKWIIAQPGVEYWMHGELSDSGHWAVGPEHYLGPTVMLQFGKIWWSTGFYFRLNGLETPPPASNVPYGAFWARTIIGINL